MEHDKYKSCKGYPDRVTEPNCHETCAGYKARQEQNAKKKAAQREFADYVSATCDAVERTKRCRSSKDLMRRKQ